MSNSKILDLKGQPLPTADKTLQREHVSEKVLQMRKMLSDTLLQMQQAWKRDMMGDRSGATVPNEEAISAHYKQAWLEQCTKILNTGEPVELDMDAMEKWIANELRERQRTEQMHMPMHQLADLEPMGFKLLMMLRGGPLWASTECAVWLPAGGDTHVWVRGQSQRPEMFILMLDGDVQNGQPDVQLPDYTLMELTGLLQSMRRQRPAHPAESWLTEAREALHKLASR